MIRYHELSHRLLELQYPELRGNGKNFIKGEGGKFAGSRPGSGSGSASEKPIDKSAESGIIKAGSGYVTISSIEQPIEQQHTGKGNPNAILLYDVELTNRQKELLSKLPDYDSRTIVPKSSVNMADLSALTAKTGDEFAMFTKGDNRLIVRGNSKMVNITQDAAADLAKQGYKWSGHTHPGVTTNVLLASSGDKAILNQFSQDISVIYNSKGMYLTFGKE